MATEIKRMPEKEKDPDSPTVDLSQNLTHDSRASSIVGDDSSNKFTDPLIPQKTHELESQNKSEPWPKSILFIISNEFCERFTFYGMRTVLVLYFTQILSYSDDSATKAFHIFAMACYFTPVIGAIIADSLLGKFWTILSISLIYSLGSIVLSIASIKGGVALTFIGLGLIAFGTGGIKPCVSAFGGDQFKASQASQLATFFSMFYVSINAGSLISTSVTPILRSDVHCFDAESCFPLAFGVPAVLMIVAVGLFILGKFLTNYIIVPPGKGNVLVTVCKIVFYSLTNRKGAPREHWLDYADDKYEPKTVQDVKILMQILYLYIPLPIFWALFDQQSSRWTLQAVQMNGNIGSFGIKPDQIQVINPLLVIAMVPVFEWAIYPAMDKFTNFNRPLRKMVIGGLLAALSFVICGFFQIGIETNLPDRIQDNHFHVSYINNLDCDIFFLGKTIGKNEFGKFDNQEKFNISAELTFRIEKTEGGCTAGDYPVNIFPQIDDPEKQFPDSVMFYLTDDILKNKRVFGVPHRNMLVKPEHGGSNMYVIYDIEGFDKFRAANGRFISEEVKKDLVHIEGSNITATRSMGYIERYEASVTTKKIKFSYKVDDMDKKDIAELDIKQGGGYIAILKGTYPDNLEIKLQEIVKANTLSVFWQIIQYFVITSAEIMFSITGLEFSYSQAPKSMKSVIQACWLLTVAFGNLLVAVIAELSFFKAQSAEFFFFAILMAIDICIFAVMAYYYKPIQLADESAYTSTNETQLDTMDTKVAEKD